MIKMCWRLPAHSLSLKFYISYFVPTELSKQPALGDWALARSELEIRKEDISLLAIARLEIGPTQISPGKNTTYSVLNITY